MPFGASSAGSGCVAAWSQPGASRDRDTASAEVCIRAACKCITRAHTQFRGAAKVGRPLSGRSSA
eukprot:5431151-Alexandrium_andersonii.AAC.1